MQVAEQIPVANITLQRAIDLEQFRFQEPRNKSRRIGLKYYVLWKDEDHHVAVMVQEEVSPETDPDWLKEAISLGAIYLKKVDFDMTLASLESNQNNVKV